MIFWKISSSTTPFAWVAFPVTFVIVFWAINECVVLSKLTPVSTSSIVLLITKGQCESVTSTPIGVAEILLPSINTLSEFSASIPIVAAIEIVLFLTNVWLSGSIWPILIRSIPSPAVFMMLFESIISLSTSLLAWIPTPPILSLSPFKPIWLAKINASSPPVTSTAFPPTSSMIFWKISFSTTPLVSTAWPVVLVIVFTEIKACVLFV